MCRCMMESLCVAEVEEALVAELELEGEALSCGLLACMANQFLPILRSGRGELITLFTLTMLGDTEIYNKYTDARRQCNGITYIN